MPEKYFSIKRKVDRASIDLQKRNTNHNLKIRIHKIEYIGEKEAQCITIDSPNHLYITDNFVVTHNSFVKNKLGGGVEPRTVNSDTWTEFLGAGAKGQWGFFKDDIKRITSNQLAGYINSMLPLWIDGTSTNPGNTVSRKGMLEGFGYDTGMLWVNTSLDVAMERAVEREKKIGRHVDPDFIVKAWETVNKLKPYYKQHFKWFKEVNNNDGELTDAILMKLYKETHTFFTSPLHSELGKYYKEELTTSGGKYLIDLDNVTMDMIKQKVKGWFSY